MFLSKTAHPATVNTESVKFRDPASLPPQGTDQLFDYVCGLRQDAPFDTVHLLGINFEKRVTSSEASFVDNAGKHFPDGFLVFALTEKQAQAIRDRAKLIRKSIPARYDSKKEEWTEASEVGVSEFLILQHKDGFKLEFTTPSQLPEPPQEEKDFGTELLKEQAKKAKKDK